MTKFAVFDLQHFGNNVGKWAEKIERSSSTLLTLITIIGCFAIGSIFFLAHEFIFRREFCSIAVIGIVSVRFANYVYFKYKQGVLQTLREWVFILIPTIGAILGITFATFLIFDVGFFALFSPDWLVQLYLFIGLEYACFLSIGILSMYRAIEMKMVARFWTQFALFIAPMVLIFLIAFNTIPSGSPSGLIFLIGSAVIAALFVLWVWRIDDKTTRIQVARNFGLLLVGSFLAVFFFLDPLGILPWITPSASIIQGTVPIIGGQEAPVNYVSYVWFIFFQSPAAAILIAIMSFGTAVTIFTSTLGNIGWLKGIGVIITTLIPMLIIVQIFTGGIAPPDLLVDLFDKGIASVVFAVCEVGVFTMMAVLLGYFSGFARLLTERF